MRDWLVEYVTDSRVVLRRTLIGRLLRDPAAAVAGFSAVFFALCLAGTVEDAHIRPTLFRNDTIALFFVVLVFIGALIWIFGVRDEILAEPDRLTVIRRFGPRTWQRSAQDQIGFLVIRTKESRRRGERVVTRSLRIEAGGHQWSIDKRSFYPGIGAVLFNMGFGQPDDVRPLADFLAQKTGWKVIDSG